MASKRWEEEAVGEEGADEKTVGSPIVNRLIFSLSFRAPPSSAPRDGRPRAAETQRSRCHRSADIHPLPLSLPNKSLEDISEHVTHNYGPKSLVSAPFYGNWRIARRDLNAGSTPSSSSPNPTFSEEESAFRRDHACADIFRKSRSFGNVTA